MEKIVKYFLWIATAILLLGIVIALNIPKPKLTIFEESDLREAVKNLNSDLPRNIGTIGSLDSISFHEKTIIYNVSVIGDNRIKDVYIQNYDKFKDVLKYTVLVMNGQRNNGKFFASVLNNKKLNLGLRIFTEDREYIDWKIPGSDLKEFAYTFTMNPTEALQAIIDVHIEIANIHLPVTLEDLRNPIKSVVLNSVFKDIDESCLPHAVTHINNDIIFEYDVDESVIPLDGLDEVKEDPETLNQLLEILTADEDIYEFMGIIALSHSNIVLTYNGRESHTSVSICIPYTILREHCKIPHLVLK